jgi:S-formylglutathione hydrolase
MSRAGENDAYDFGTGAGFYIDATQAPWSTNYKMYTYITEELSQLVKEGMGLPVDPTR